MVHSSQDKLMFWSVFAVGAETMAGWCNVSFVACDCFILTLLLCFFFTHPGLLTSITKVKEKLSN